ncbi:MAG TPA: TetR/AcrR family transcriptional regulator [Streptosporangiaceae bacterium]|jgi:AcrR family transcriptional regulator
MNRAGRATTVRERIVRAAEECFESHGVAKTTVETIAAAAGMSRATVYRHFSGGKDEVIREVVVRDVGDFLAEAEKRLRGRVSAGDALVDSIMGAVAFVRGRPRLALLFAPEFAGQTGKITGGDAALAELVTAYVRPYFDQAQAAGQIRAEVDVADAVELVLRIVFSLITVPSPQQRTDTETRRFVRTCVVSALVTTP